MNGRLLVSCAHCGDRLDPLASTTWRRVIGWERKAIASSRRGGSDIALREPREEYACDGCITKLKNRLAVEQMGLL